MFLAPKECRKNVASMDPTRWYSSQEKLNLEVQDLLPDRLVHMRFELPFTAPSITSEEEDVFETSLEGDYSKLCIDLKSD